ncbi:MAG: PAS domain S-box protein [Candidatus Paceibacterota bacterium]|jgi:PAS domain S-box-containing protein
MDTLFLNEHRCKCGKLLLRGVFFDGALEIKCHRCGEINEIGRLKLENDKYQYLLIINDQGIVTNASDSAYRILGYDNHELIGEHFTSINPTMPEEIGQKFFGQDSRLSEDNYYQLDTFHQNHNGEKIPVTIFVKLYLPTNKKRHVLLSVKLRDLDLSSIYSEQEESRFLDKACDFYFDIDKNGKGEYISPSVEKLFGFTQEAILGKNYFSFLPASNVIEARKTFDYFSSRQEPYRVLRDTGFDSRGQRIHNELYFTPKFDDKGDFSGYRVLGWVIKTP